MSKRGYLTEREKLAMLRAQRWRCVCRENCGQPLWPGAPVRWDHRPPHALTGAAKPNQGVTPHCHDILTKQDVKDISRAVRLEKKAKGTWRFNRKLRSRGFDKTLTKKFGGEVVPRKKKAPVCSGSPEALKRVDAVTITEQSRNVKSAAPVSASRQPNAEQEKSGPCLAASRDVGGAIGP